MKSLKQTKIVVIAAVVFCVAIISSSCSKKSAGNGNWVTINKANVEECFRTSLGKIDSSQSYFDLDDLGPDLGFEIFDVSKRTVGFKSDYFTMEDADYPAWMEFESDGSGVMISLELSYQGGKGQALVNCELEGVRLEIGEAEFIAK